MGIPVPIVTLRWLLLEKMSKFGCIDLFMSILTMAILRRIPFLGSSQPVVYDKQTNTHQPYVHLFLPQKKSWHLVAQNRQVTWNHDRVHGLQIRSLGGFSNQIFETTNHCCWKKHKDMFFNILKPNRLTSNATHGKLPWNETGPCWPGGLKTLVTGQRSNIAAWKMTMVIWIPETLTANT